MYGILKIATRGSIFEKEIREISNMDYKLENGRYQYRRKDIEITFRTDKTHQLELRKHSAVIFKAFICLSVNPSRERTLLLLVSILRR